MSDQINEKKLITEEKKASIKGMPVLIFNILFIIAAILGFIFCLIRLSEKIGNPGMWIVLLIACALYIFLISPLLFIG